MKKKVNDPVDISFPKKAATKLAKTQDMNQPLKAARRSGVQSFGDFVSDNMHKRLDEMIDQTIYIVKIEPQASDTYGSGFKLWFKDLPNARDTYTAACYGAYVVPQLEQLYANTNKGTRIGLESPVKTTIRQAGKSYRFA